jgi:hypothetical protein
MRRARILACLLCAWCAGSLPAAPPFVFEDVTAASGLAALLEGDGTQRPWRYAHGAGWGDFDGDGRLDLYLGAFAARPWFQGDAAPLPNLLLANTPQGFRRVPNAPLEFASRTARCAGVLWVDLDGDGDLDLLVMNHQQQANHTASKLFENLGRGEFRDVTPDTPPFSERYGFRNATAIDIDRDGRLELLLADGSYGRPAMQRAHFWVLKRQADGRYVDVSQELGLPAGETSGLGLAVADVNDDGRLDVFVAGCQRLFVSTSEGRFTEADRTPFAVTPADPREGMHCGAAFADLNGDGWPDLVTTEHGVPARIHVFQHRGLRDGLPRFVEVSDSAGVGELFPAGTRTAPIKTAHVALEDMDHDGRPDVVLTVLQRLPKSQKNSEVSTRDVQPVVLQNLSERGGPIRLSKPPFERMATYFAPGPVGDYDGDGRLDLFLPSWFEEQPSLLLRNVTPGGQFLHVRVAGSGRLNAMGLGARVTVFEAGRMNDLSARIGQRDVVIGTGYASCEEAAVHFGLGDRRACDLEVRWQDRVVRRTNVAAGQRLIITVEDAP